MSVTTIRVRIPQDSGGLSENITSEDVAKAVAARRAGNDVTIQVVGGRGGKATESLSVQRANKLFDHIINNGLPVDTTGFLAAQIPSGAYAPSRGFMEALMATGAGPMILAPAGLAALSQFAPSLGISAGGAGTTAGAGTAASGSGLLSSGTTAAGTGATAASVGGTVGDMAAMYQSAYGMTAADAMAAAEAAMASGMTPTALATTIGEAGLLTGAQIGSITGNAALSNAASTLAQQGITDSVLKQSATSPTLMQQISNATGLSPSTLSSIASTGLGMLGSYMQGSSAQDAARTAADAQVRAAQIAADAAKFRPVGVTTRFGQSQFGYDQQGNLTSAGYQLSPELKAQQDTLMGVSNQALTQYQGAQAATAPIGQGAQTLFGLGQGYLSTTPQAQAAKFMADQQALLAPTREREMAALQSRLQAQGRLGLATGGTSTGLMASNPELEAFYNAQRMQDLQLAAQATQGGQQYATFGAGLLGTGSDLQRSMYGTQQAAYAPYQTALGGATTIEQLGQQPMDIGTAIGAKTSTAAAQAGILQAQGMTNAAQTMQPANAYSPWGALLSGAGQAISQYGQPQQQTYKFDPFTGRAL